MIAFRFEDVSRELRDWWLVLQDGEADVCDHDPGFDVTVTVTASLRGMTRVWRGDLAWSAALRSGAVRVQGAPTLSRAVPTWFALSPFAGVPRP